MLRWMTAGESHGPALLATIERLPPGLYVMTKDLRRDLVHRRLGYGRDARQKFEADEVSILAGVRRDAIIGAPVVIRIGNSEWPKRETMMSADPVDPSGLLIGMGTGDEREIARNRPLTRPWPGHVDLSGMLSCDLSDARPVLERVSAYEAVVCVALDASAEALLEQVVGVRFVFHVVFVGAQYATASSTPTPAGEMALHKVSMRTFDPEDDVRFEAVADTAKQAGDMISGVVEVIAYDVPVGLGTYVTVRERLDVRLATVLMLIQSAKGAEIGDGLTQAALLGSVAHDEIVRGKDGHLACTSNHAGNIGGGMSSGASIVAHAAFKPISTVPHTLRSVDLATGKEAVDLHQRSDTCQMIPGIVIAEAEMVLVFADALSDHAGDRSVGEMHRNPEAHLVVVGERV